MGEKEGIPGAGEIAQRPRALATLSEVIGSIPGTHMVAYKNIYNSILGDPIFLLALGTHVMNRHIQAKHSHTYIECTLKNPPMLRGNVSGSEGQGVELWSCVAPDELWLPSQHWALLLGLPA